MPTGTCILEGGKATHTIQDYKTYMTGVSDIHVHVAELEMVMFRNLSEYTKFCSAMVTFCLILNKL